MKRRKLRSRKIIDLYMNTLGLYRTLIFNAQEHIPFMILVILNSKLFTKYFQHQQNLSYKVEAQSSITNFLMIFGEFDGVYFMYKTKE